MCQPPSYEDSVDIPDPVYRKLIPKAALEGSTVKDAILQSVSRDLSGPLPKRRIKFPLIHAKDKGRLDLSNTQIYDLLFE
jgi:hypothetical protein